MMGCTHIVRCAGMGVNTAEERSCGILAYIFDQVVSSSRMLIQDRRDIMNKTRHEE